MPASAEDTDTPVIDKVANSEQIADCVMDNFKSDMTKAFNKLNTDAAIHNQDNTLNPEVQVALAEDAAWARIMPNIIECTGKIVGVSRNNLPEAPNFDYIDTNSPKSEEQFKKYQEFMEKYTDNNAFNQAMSDGFRNKIDPLINEMENEIRNTAIQNSSPNPAP